MKVKLKDIKPNPWRYINKGYPIDPVKIDQLRNSIKRTGFWDNVLGRSVNGGVEIAYGHHRLEALRKEFSASYEINVIVRKLDDAEMLKIMAHENEMMDQMSPAVINETVRAARDFLEKESRAKNPDGHARQKKPRKDGSIRQCDAIAKFLSWKTNRIEMALAAIHDIESGAIGKREYESLKSQRTADDYRRLIHKYPLPKKERTKILRKLKRGTLEAKKLKEVIIGTKFNGRPVPKPKADINDVASQLASDLNHACLMLSDGFIDNFDHVGKEVRGDIKRSLINLSGKLKKLQKKHSNIKLLEA